MIDKSKIILMSKLAVYDKKYGACDKKRNEYFQRDYVYKQNFSLRLGVAVAGAIIFLFYIFNKVFVQSVDVFSIDIYKEAQKFTFFLISLFVFYTIIGTIIAIYDYNISQARLKKYFKMLNQLEKINVEPINNKEANRYSYGSDLYSKEFFN